MAAGLGFKDFTTGEVLTAADVDGYLMQGVWVFASAAARDAAVTSPQEGNFAYLKDTNVTTYYTGSAWANLDTTGMTNPMTTTGDTIYSSSGSTPARLGIGTAGQVLTVNSGATAPEWATPSSGGGMTLISTTSLTTTRPTLSSITSAYKDLVLIVSNFYFTGASDSENFKLEINGSTANTFSTGVGQTTTYARSNIELSGGTPITSTNNSITLLIKNYASTTLAKSFTVFGAAKAGSGSTNIVGGVFSSTSAVSSLVITNTNDVQFAAGTALLYGVS